MRSQAKVLHDVFKQQGTLKNMNTKIVVYGHSEPVNLIIQEGVVTLKYSDGSTDIYPDGK